MQPLHDTEEKIYMSKIREAFEKGKALIVDVQPNVTYTGNKISVNQVLNILIDNAIKHASENGSIIIDFHKEKGKPVLSVSNTIFALFWGR